MGIMEINAIKELKEIFYNKLTCDFLKFKYFQINQFHMAVALIVINIFLNLTFLDNDIAILWQL